MMMRNTSVMAMVMMTSMIGDDYYDSDDDCDDNDGQHHGLGGLSGIIIKVTPLRERGY